MNEAVQARGNDEEMEDRRQIVSVVLEPLRRATGVVDALISDVRDGRKKFTIPNYEKPVSCRKIVMNELNKIALRVVDRLCRRRPSELASNLEQFKTAIISYSDCLDDLLLILLGLYSNGTPQPGLSQILANEIDRIGGLPSVTHMMKAYGDVYRIERRRWAGYEQRKEKNNSDPPVGILTVVDNSIFVNERNYLRVEADTAYNNAVGCKKFEEQAEKVSSTHDSPLLRPLAAAMAERMARLYCTFQIIWYVRLGYRIKVLWLPVETVYITEKEDTEEELKKWIGKLLKGTSSVSGQDLEQEMRKLQLRSGGASPYGLHCVLNSREGVVRELGQSVGSQTSRLTFSAIHHRLRHDIEKNLEENPGERLFPI